MACLAGDGLFDKVDQGRVAIDFHGNRQHRHARSPVRRQPHPVFLGGDHLGAVALRILLNLGKVMLRIGMVIGKGQPADASSAGRFEAIEET